MIASRDYKPRFTSQSQVVWYEPLGIDPDQDSYKIVPAEKSSKWRCVFSFRRSARLAGIELENELSPICDTSHHCSDRLAISTLRVWDVS